VAAVELPELQAVQVELAAVVMQVQQVQPTQAVAAVVLRLVGVMVHQVLVALGLSLFVIRTLMLI
jgi:hypothetical protein